MSVSACPTEVVVELENPSLEVIYYEHSQVNESAAYRVPSPNPVSSTGVYPGIKNVTDYQNLLDQFGTPNANESNASLAD